MKNRLGIIVLILICVALSIGLVWSRRDAGDRISKQTERVEYYSNQVVSTSSELHNSQKVNAELEADRERQKSALQGLTNLYSRTSATLEKTQTELQATQAEMARQLADREKRISERDTRIAELESQNHTLDERANDLSNSITNLTGQIEDTRRKLAASEGNRSFLEKELQRLMAEKAELERQFNDLATLRTQIAKIKEEMTISRRLDWIRKGLFPAGEQKGAQLLISRDAFPAAKPEKPAAAYDLNVEVNSDGSVRVIPPPTNHPPQNPAPAQ